MIRRWTGKTWRPVTLPAKISTAFAKEGTIASQLGAVSARSVWFFGGVEGGYLRLNGGRRSLGRLPGAGPKSALVDILAVKVFSSTDVWAFGERDTQTATQIIAKPYVAHYNGRQWARMTVPGPASGSTAITAGPPLRAGDQLTGAVVEPNGNIWFGGSAKNTAKGTTPLTAAWNGTSWSVKDLPMGATSTTWQLDAMTPDGTGGIWALARAGVGAKEQIWHLRGDTWSLVSLALGKRRWVLEGLALVPRTHSVWAAGVVRAGKSGADGLIAVDGRLPR